MKKTRRASFALAVTAGALVAYVLSGCSAGSGQPSPAQSADKGTLTLGMTADISGWDPAVQSWYQGWSSMAVWDQLFRCGVDGKAQAGMADSWDFSADNTSLTVHVRPGMKFTNGEPVNAHALEVALPHLFNTATSQLPGLTVSTSDELTATVTLPKPNPSFESILCNTPIAAPESIAAGEESKAWTTPIGSGPYVLDETATTTGSVYSFTKNPDYWDADTFPYPKLVLKVLSNNTAAVNALKTGQIDGSLVPSTSFNEVKAAPELTTLRFSGLNVTRLLITDHLGKVIPALGNVDVRRAMNMVFDRKALADNLYHGLATPSYQIFREGSAAYDPGLKDPYPYDVEKAKKLMAKAGYADGFTLQFPTVAGNDMTVLPYVQQQLALINIKVEEVTLSGPNWPTELFSGKYPVILWQLGNNADSTLDMTGYVLPDAVFNVSHQPDDTINSMWSQILAGKDVEANQKAINHYITEQAWFAPLVSPDSYYAHSQRVSIPEITDYSAQQPALWDFQ